MTDDLKNSFPGSSEYTCEDCALHEHEDEPEHCKNQDKDHKPCENFHPADYIKSLNYDTR